MIKQMLFILSLVVTLVAFGYTTYRIISLFKLTRPAFPIRDIGKRLVVTLKVAIGQSKIFRRPLIGLMHALVFWGFLVILFGSIEMILDGMARTERILSILGPVYDVIIASGDLFAAVIFVAIIAFLIRRMCMHIPRFSGIEMKRWSHTDANISLLLILLLMVSLLGMNTFYIAHNRAMAHEIAGFFPVSSFLADRFSALSAQSLHTLHEINWWTHILIIFFFANYLPYSKHFHVFLSVPNVFLSNLDPPGKLQTMEQITAEVTRMMDRETAYADQPDSEVEVIELFGVLDAEDATWKNYFDSLSCTQCGRCTSVCPANITGKKLSPRKIMMDLRTRMKEKGPGMIKMGEQYTDQKSLIRDYISEEELWACTTCNACVQECPVNINQPSLIVDMRRYLVMEESAGPAELNQIFSNIENNGAPWQFPREDRMVWAENLKMNGVAINVPVMAERFASGQIPDYLLWIGSAGAFDDRYKKVTRAFVKILNHLGIDYAVLGTEESSSGDVARRAGNEMLFQMQAMMNAELLAGYEAKKILTCDPHAYNTFKNEYPDFGGKFEVLHHTQFLNHLVETGKLSLGSDALKGKVVTFHDPCYLGRANGEYDAPRKIINSLPVKFMEMRRNKSFALCCGAGGGQMFKEAEQGDREIFTERTEDALKTGADIIATACPYCMVMLTDGLKYANREDEIKNLDIAELVALSLNLQ
jgi:Fe-S oxidoreductase/nitrate reductase gamma subunit